MVKFLTHNPPYRSQHEYLRIGRRPEEDDERVREAVDVSESEERSGEVSTFWKLSSLCFQPFQEYISSISGTLSFLFSLVVFSTSEHILPFEKHSLC